MLIDIHTHLIYTDEQNCKDQLEILRKCYGVDRAIVSTLFSYEPSEEEITACNDATYRYMQECPDYISGLCYLNPRHDSSTQELCKRLDQGFVGVKLWVATLCDDASVDPIAETCIQRNVPILIHTFYKAVGQLSFESRGEHVASLAKRFPQLKLVMAHLGASAFRELPAIKNCTNVYVDFSGSICHSDDLSYAVELLGADRILFGSDCPGIGFHPSYGQLLDVELTDVQREAIAWKNADELFFGGQYGAL